MDTWEIAIPQSEKRERERERDYLTSSLLTEKVARTPLEKAPGQMYDARHNCVYM